MTWIALIKPILFDSDKVLFCYNQDNCQPNVLYAQLCDDIVFFCRF